MKIYIPKIQDISIGLLNDGWHIIDKFGPLWGPYATCNDAKRTVESGLINNGFAGCRHASYAEAAE